MSQFASLQRTQPCFLLPEQPLKYYLSYQCLHRLQSNFKSTLTYLWFLAPFFICDHRDFSYFLEQQGVAKKQRETKLTNQINLKKQMFVIIHSGFMGVRYWKIFFPLGHLHIVILETKVQTSISRTFDIKDSRKKSSCWAPFFLHKVFKFFYSGVYISADKYVLPSSL